MNQWFVHDKSPALFTICVKTYFWGDKNSNIGMGWLRLKREGEGWAYDWDFGIGGLQETYRIRLVSDESKIFMQKRLIKSEFDINC